LPYETDSEGLGKIVAMWHERATRIGTGDWTFEWQLAAINGDTFVVTGVGNYPTLGDFKNLWVVSLGDDGKASTFRMWNNLI
jgi:hypothetical protein